MTKRELKKRCEELEVGVSEYKELYNKYFNESCRANDKNDYLCMIIEMYKYLAGIDKESDTYLFKYNGKIFRVLSYETSKEAGCHEDLVLRCKEVEIKNEWIPVWLPDGCSQ